ncbi:MAG: TetR/AcrR family transcriptional regulator [Deferrisomatales bacterium]
MGEERLGTEVRREQIAEAALALISERGLGGLSVAAVARRVGLVPSAIYRHFEGKEGVVDAVVGLIRDRLLRNVREACTEADDALDCLRRILTRHVQLIRNNVGVPRVVFSEELYASRPGRKGEVHAVVAGYLASVAEVIRRGQAAGCIRPGLEPGTLAVMFLGLVQPSAILWHLSDGQFDVTKHTQRAWEVFRGAIEAPGRPQPSQRRESGSEGELS